MYRKKRFLLFMLCTVIFTGRVAFGNTINITWNDLPNTTTCEPGGDIAVPNITPTPPSGKHFVGWQLTFHRIEYLESTGTQYIDTGIIANEKTSMHIKIQITDVSRSHQIVGTRIYNMQTLSSSGSFSSTRVLGIRYGTTTANRLNIAIAENNILEIYQHKRNVYLNDQGLYTVLPEKTFEDTVPIFLCGYNNVLATNPEYGSLKILFLKIYDNDVLVRDFIPVIDFNGVACMYDRVSKAFFYNGGTGDFISGPDIGFETIDTENLYSPGDIITNVCGTNDIIFYPVYENNTVSLTWNDNNGNITQSTCIYGDTITLPTPPTRTGYIFNGWTVQRNNE